ncbi:hypothetical protein BH09BAC1_BH09BAC1_14010 [soil metagenome]
MLDINKAQKEIATGADFVNYLLEHSIAEHPFFKSGQNTNIGYIYVILENGRDLDITGFLARLISIIPNVDIRSKLVPQLYDELGGGDLSKIHVKYIASFLKALKPFAHTSAEDAAKLEKAYQELGATYKRLFGTQDIYEGIGVAIANEIIVQPIFEYFKAITGPVMHHLTPEARVWISSHDEVEDHHITDSIDLANMLKPNSEEIEKAVKGAVELFNGMWIFFNTVAEVKLHQHEGSAHI